MTVKRRCIAGLFALALSGPISGAAGAPEKPINWCNLEPPPEPWRGDPFDQGAYRDIWPVRPGHIAEAVTALRDVPAIRLSRTKAESYVGSLPTGGKYHYYLVRGSVYAPDGASPDELFELAHSPMFFVQWLSHEDGIQIVTWQPALNVPSRATNFPLVLRGAKPISHVYGGCFSIP
jgi:hypothetical protein